MANHQSFSSLESGFCLQPEHKIQSSDGPLQLSLELVPKMLEALVKNWVQQAFVVSFKVSFVKNTVE